MKQIKIGPGEHHVSRTEGTVIITVLGSCVSACIRDPVALVGGMNHFMLPESETGQWGGTSANMRYGNFAMEELINDILRAGGLRTRLEIKLFGGARIMTSGGAVGHQNADFAEAYLSAEKMPIAAKHLRGDSARRIEYEPLNGRVRMLEMSLERAKVVPVETRLFITKAPPQDGGSVELFD